jgi:hypothetical protein
LTAKQVRLALLSRQGFARQILAERFDIFNVKPLYGILRLRLSRNGGQSPPAPISRALLRFASHRQSILSG